MWSSTTVNIPGGQPPEPEVRLNPQVSLSADGSLLVSYSLYVPGETPFAVAAAVVQTPDGELPLTVREPAALQRMRYGPPPAGEWVHGALAAPIPARGGVFTLRVTALAPLEPGVSAQAPAGPWEFAIEVPDTAVDQWHRGDFLDIARPLPGGAVLRVHRWLRTAERTIIWAEVHSPGLAGYRSWQPMPLQATLIGAGVPLHGVGWHQAYRDPIQHFVVPTALPGGPPLTCHVQALVYGALPGAPAVLRFAQLTYALSHPWSLTVPVPPERPGVRAEPLEYTVAGLPLRLEEVLLGRYATALFFTVPTAEKEGMQARLNLMHHWTIRDGSGQFYAAGGGGGGGERFQSLMGPIAAGQSELIIGGDAVDLQLPGQIDIDLP